MQAFWFLHSLDRASVIYLFWYTIIFEIPRYTIGTVIVITARLWVRAPPPLKTDFKLSVILAGHNEVNRCAPALKGSLNRRSWPISAPSR
jgi:hypothetical protein